MKMDRLRTLVRPRHAVVLALLLFGFFSLFPSRVIGQSSGTQPSTAPQTGVQTSSSASAPDAQLPSFEVASIKKHAPENGPGMRVTMGGPDVSQFRAANVTVKMLIATAYNVREFQISGGPSWISSERWDIDAKVEESLAAKLKQLPKQQQQAQQALMIRPLLADRFKLQIAKGSKEGTILALVIAKSGPKLKEVPPPDPGAGAPALPPPGPRERGGGPPMPPPGGAGMMINGSGLATLAANAQPISNLVNMLSMQLGQQVVDETGLKGTYQYTLQFSAQGGPAGMPLPSKPGDAGPDAADASSDAPSIYTALQDQLGLKLESTKGQIDTITIDRIEEPSEN